MTTSSSIDDRCNGISSKMSASMGSLPKSAPASPTQRSRIPATLQAVFIASNRGNEVHKPPPDAAASKTYFRNWLFQNKTLNSGGSLESPTKDRKNRRNILRSFTEHLPALARNKNKNNKKGKTKASDQTTKSNDKKHNTSKSSKELHSISKFSKEKPLSETEPPSPKRKKKKPQVTLEPQQYLDSMIRSRGYSTIRYKTLESGYYYKPTELQQASYDPYIIRVVKKSECDELRKMLNCGMSPNPCNSFGESLLHTICRTGNSSLLQIMIEAESDVAVADDYGRTPLHDACWSAKENIFNVIELLLAKEDGPSMFYLADCRGSVPLQYVARDHWGQWIQWLEAHKDQYWPRRNRVVDGEQPPPPLTQLPPNSRAAHIPSQPLTTELAKMLVSGKMTPDEIQVLRADIGSPEQVNDDDDDDDDSSTDDENEENSDDSEFDSDDDDSDDDDDPRLYADEEEMTNLINFMNSRRSAKIAT